MILFGESSLRRGITEYLAHYHAERNHQGLDNRLIEPENGISGTGGTIECRERLGGMLRYYHRQAAQLTVDLITVSVSRTVRPSKRAYRQALVPRAGVVSISKPSRSCRRSATGADDWVGRLNGQHGRGFRSKAEFGSILDKARSTTSLAGLEEKR